MDEEPRLLKLSEVRTITGVPAEALHLLIRDDLLPGTARGSAGHTYVRADKLPTYDGVLTLLRTQLERHLHNAVKQLDRVQAEIEAVRNDITMALEEPLEELGHDLLTLRTRSNDPRSSSLTSTLDRLETRSWEVRSYHDAIRSMLRDR